MPSFLTKFSDQWKPVKGFLIKQDDVWKPIKKGYVKQDNTWKLFWSLPITITITEDTISNSENSIVITNPENYRLDVTYSWNGSEWQPNFNYGAKKCWYNIDIAQILATFGLNNATYYNRDLNINLNDVWIGGKHGNLAYNGSVFYLDQSLRYKAALSVTGLDNFTNVTINANGNCKIQGFGGFAIERRRDSYHGYYPYGALDEGSDPAYDDGKVVVPSKDYFGANFCYRRNDYGWRSYTDEYRLNAMKLATKYINFNSLYPAWNPNDIATWQTYKAVIIQRSLLDDLIPYTYNMDEFQRGFINPDCLNSKNRQGKLACNGGNALQTDIDVKIICPNGSTLLIAAGCGGGQMICRRGGEFGNGVVVGSSGGRGLPSGVGSLTGYVHKQEGQDVSSDFDDQLRGDGSSTGNFDNSIPRGASLKAGNYNTMGTDPLNLNYKYLSMFGILNAVDGSYTHPDCYRFLNDPSVHDICIAGNLNTSMTQLSYDFNVASPGVAINAGGANVNVTTRNITVIGPWLLRGDGLSPNDWYRVG